MPSLTVDSGGSSTERPTFSILVTLGASLTFSFSFSFVAPFSSFAAEEDPS